MIYEVLTFLLGLEVFGMLIYMRYIDIQLLMIYDILTSVAQSRDWRCFFSLKQCIFFIFGLIKSKRSILEHFFGIRKGN